VTPSIDEALVRMCMQLAAAAAADGDPPFGAILVGAGGEVLARARNTQASASDPTSHAEINLLRSAARAGHLPPLRGSRIVVNAEPCSMCASAIVKAEIDELVFGAPHEPHMDPDLAVADVFALARRPPRIVAGVLAIETAAQIAQARLGAPPID
jgi:tRNA(adenine34) deaminase